jgi:hypothetical protein
MSCGEGVTAGHPVFHDCRKSETAEGTGTRREKVTRRKCNPKGVLADLEVYRSVLEQAKQVGARWNLQADF